MEVGWSQLREEARRLAQEIGESGREHHSLANSCVVRDAIRAHGIPLEHREWVWPILLHDQRMKVQRYQSDIGATYSQLLHGATEDVYDSDTNSSLGQAQEEAMEKFHHLNPFQERKIRRILLAYAKSKDAFYYCHGMVESCVVLSTFLVEEDAFWSFRMLLEALLPKYFDESVVDFHTDCLVLQDLLHTHDSALSEHFALRGVSIQLLCTKWFFSFFAESMPFEVVCRLYDIMFVDVCSRYLDSKIIFSTSLSVLLYLSSTLIEIQDVNVVLDVINEFCLTTLTEYSVAESFLDLVHFMHERIDGGDLAAFRQKYRAQLAQEKGRRKILQRKIQKKKSSKRLKVEMQESLERHEKPRKGRIHHMKLLIQWKKHMKDAPDALTSQFMIRNYFNRSNCRNKRSRCSQNSGICYSEQDGPSLCCNNESRGSDTAEAGLEFVTTPTEKEMIVRVHQGISKISLRRARTLSSMRTVSLRGSDIALSSTSSRNLSLSNSLLSNSSSNKDCDDTNLGDDNDTEDEDALWERLRLSGTTKSVVQCSMSGVPDSHRSWIWPILINQIPSPSDLSQALIAVKNYDEDDLLDREIAKSIENDITRTRTLRNDQVVPMRRVLTAFAYRNRRVGYCQGMNEILVVLLQYLDEDQALQALILLIEVLLPSYHVDSMIGLHTDCAVMNTLLRQNDVELHAHFNELGLNMEILCTKWLVTCFLTSLPVFCGLKVIDMLLARSKEKQRASRVLLGVGISIFFTLRETLLEAKDAGEVLLAINEYFAREMKKTTDEMDNFLHFCMIITDQLEPDIVEGFRLVHKDEVMERFAAFEAKKIEMRHQLEEAKAKQRKVTSAPPSPSKMDRLSTLSASSILAGKPYSSNRIAGLSAYISKPLRGSGSNRSVVADRGGDKKCHQRYQRIDALHAHHNFGEDLVKMEGQLLDLADLYVRGKIDEKEHSCIRAQIVRKWCKGMNSPQSAMERVQSVKHSYGERSGGEDFTNNAPDLQHIDVLERSNITDDARRGRKGSSSLYGRMKKAQKNALAIFKSTFE
ncbi:hypothetical protein CCR75_004750 [Bremia lactucae]|uniref:Rab-GAP TBC domain-containing protein n=1 Tax=Bremia lactucae TaxID=4779 RepID=A0A976FLN2_BRELC|nr:hypothetical protein CCR75_004750 [Bremia lactucae]